MKTNKEILKFALPAIIENFLQMLVGVSDTMIVAHLSLSAVAAVSLANNLITVYQAIFIALGTIISSLFAKVLIEKKAKEKSKELINSATKLTILIGLVFGLFSLFAAQPILYLLGARQQVLELSIIYLSLVGGLIVLHDSQNPNRDKAGCAYAACFIYRSSGSAGQENNCPYCQG